MNWVDVCVVVTLLLFVFQGFGRGFVSEFLDFISFLLAFLLSLRFYNYPQQLYQSTLHIPHSFASILGFITVWFLIEAILVSFMHFHIKKSNILPSLEKHLNAVAFIPAFLRGLVFVAVILLLVATFPIQPKIKLAVQRSVIGSKILAHAIRYETPLKNVFGGLNQDTLSFLTIKPKSDQVVNLGFKTEGFKVAQNLELQMIDLVNEERTNRGFSSLTLDLKLTEVGRMHSQDMFERGYFSHYSPEGDTVSQRVEKFNISYLSLGENLAYAPNLELAHKGLMNSEGHRANILSQDFYKIGIGIMDGGVYGLMVTQVFSN